VAIKEAQRLTEQLEVALAKEEKEQQQRSRRGESVYTNPIEAFIDNPVKEDEDEEMEDVTAMDEEKSKK